MPKVNFYTHKPITAIHYARLLRTKLNSLEIVPLRNHSNPNAGMLLVNNKPITDLIGKPIDYLCQIANSLYRNW